LLFEAKNAECSSPQIRRAGEISTAAGAFVINRRRLTAGTRLADDRDG